MNDDQPTSDPTRASRGRLVRVVRTLAASATRGLATGAGTATGTWIVWWITHH
ncbi:hypothetical protein OG948_58720 (plasmid) [Embleya sp. NBC_00888]|uniref:hypothetical protein n=1 Tax=Embleya sp. NBC_00888 TaxID=2975960 RepID=UPI002F90AB38|nr:hypothetical protein OG948_58720 [Embleya sp. NBC_00888]